MDDLLERGTRCPSCRAAVRPGAPWCSLCHADLRPPPPPPPAPAPPVLPPAALTPPSLVQPVPAFDPLTAPAAELGLPSSARASAPGAPPVLQPVPQPAVQPVVATWPCTACGTATPLTAAACSACGTGFLAGLRATEGPLLELPVVGDLTAMPRSSRMLLAFGVVLMVAAVTALLGLLLA